MRTRLLTFVLAMLCSAGAQEKFWSSEQIMLQSANAGIHIADAVATCRNLKHGGMELTSPFQSCGGNAAWTLSAVPLSIGTSYMFHRVGRDKWAKFTPVVYAGMGAFGLGFSLTH